MAPSWMGMMMSPASARQALLGQHTELGPSLGIQSRVLAVCEPMPLT